MTPKWLQPIVPSRAELLTVRIDPRLGADDDAAYVLAQDVGLMTTMVTVFMTSNYDAVLAAEVFDDAEHGPHVLVRAATGDEAAYLFELDDDESPEDDGDQATRATAHGAHEITWCESAGEEATTEPAIVAWAGEVLLTSGQGLSGPFYAEEAPAKAWAFATALETPPEQLFGAQLVGYVCAQSKCQALLQGGDQEFRRLNRYWEAPVRSAQTRPIQLPGLTPRRDDQLC